MKGSNSHWSVLDVLTTLVSRCYAKNIFNGSVIKKTCFRMVLFHVLFWYYYYEDWLLQRTVLWPLLSPASNTKLNLNIKSNQFPEKKFLVTLLIITVFNKICLHIDPKVQKMCINTHGGKIISSLHGIILCVLAIPTTYL